MSFNNRHAIPYLFQALYKIARKSCRNNCNIIVMLVFLSLTSCKKLIEVNAPLTSTNAVNIYSDDATAAAVLTGIYTTLSQSDFANGGIASMSLFPALSGDELKLHDGSTNTQYIAYYTNSLNANIAGSNTAEFWANFFSIIFSTNSAIEGLTSATTLTPAVRQQLIGEAKFIRAFCYFYLVNLYGDVPLVLSTDYQANALLTRSIKTQVYQQIVTDLKDAGNLLDTDYVDASVINTTLERVRPNKWVAMSLLARVYLYMRDYVNAEIQATAIINHTDLYSLDNLNNVFLKNSRETIWQLQPVVRGYNTQEGMLFVLPSTGPDVYTHSVYLSKSLLNSFEAGDLRKKYWIDSVIVGINTFYHPYKYKVSTLDEPVTEYTMVFRLGEQYLLRAEARVQQGNTSAAISDLNLIRTRAGLPNTTATTQSAILNAILHERQVELFTEWGHRWFDLKRTITVDTVMNEITPQKGGIWNTNWQWYPIPLSDLQKDPNLEQNSGY